MAGVHKKNTLTAWTSKGASHKELSGSAHLLLVSILTAFFVSGGCYLYSVNQNAVQGYHLRSLEKEIAVLEEKNAELRIVEADLKSLHRIEAISSEELKMQKLEGIKYLEERAKVISSQEPTSENHGGPVALR